MPHAIWKGAVSFGLVNIPVALYPAESPNELQLSMLDKRDLSPVGYRSFNKNTGKDIDRSQVVKGFEYEDGEYVIVTDEDLKRANAEATQTVDIQDFVDLSEIDPIYFDKPYYLAPVKKGEKAYALLRETLKKSGKVGIARVVIRTRQYVAALYPMDKVLVLNLLRFSHELRKVSDLGLPDEGLKAEGLTTKEVAMAGKLVDGLAAKWDPDKYKDEFRKDLLDFIETKAREGSVKKAPRKVAESGGKGEVLDLMELLKKSVAETGKEPRKTAARKPAAASRRKTATKSKKTA